MLKADYIPYTLKFREPAGTSRGVLHTKQTYFVRVYDDTFPSRAGYGEAALFRGLSAEEGAKSGWRRFATAFAGLLPTPGRHILLCVSEWKRRLPTSKAGDCFFPRLSLPARRGFP